MRRFIALSLLMLTAVLATVGTAAAEPRVGPPLRLWIYDFLGTTSVPEEATLHVEGRGCLPQDAPASVTVTVDRFPGQVFTAEPRADGRWSVQIVLETPLDGVWVVNATCDNYFGATEYPQAQINADQVLYVAADGGTWGGGAGGGDDGTTTTTGVANTGSRTRAELAVGVAAVLLGALLVVLARPRGAVAHARNHAAGRHRR